MKLNLAHFTFQETNAKVIPEIQTQYDEFKSKPNKDVYEKEFIANFEQQIKTIPKILECTHVSTGISKRLSLANKDISMEALATETLKAVREHRNLRAVGPTGTVKKFDGAKYTLVGGVFTKKGEILEVGKNTHMNDPFKQKVPRLPNVNYVGIELEFNRINAAHGHDEQKLGEALKNAGLSKYVDVFHDNTCGLEVRVLLAEGNIEGPLRAILKVILDMKFKVDIRCGTHVHLDMRNRDVEVCYSNLVSTQKLLHKFLTKERRKNKNCKLNRYADFNMHHDETSYDEETGRADKYFGINTHSYPKYKTLEVRMHQGTLDADRLISWLNLLTKIVNHKVEVKKEIRGIMVARKEFDLGLEVYKNLRKNVIREVKNV